MDLNVENHGIAQLGKKKLDIVLGVVKFDEVINGCVGNFDPAIDVISTSVCIIVTTVEGLSMSANC